jgi:tetratricopeptide (TPR) repeat protein
MQVNRIFITSIFILSFSLNAIDIDPDGTKIKNGVKSYKENDFTSALENFTAVEKNSKYDPRVSFNKGTAHYKLNDYKMAQKFFEKATTSEDKELRAKSFYNLGNSFAKLNDKKNALKAYSSALQINPNFEQAKKNIELLNSKNKDNKDENQKEQEQENKQEQQNNSSKQENKKSNKNEPTKSKQKQENNSNEDKKEDSKNSSKELSKEEAQKILENLSNDKIKRRKSMQGSPNSNEIFW